MFSVRIIGSNDICAACLVAGDGNQRVGLVQRKDCRWQGAHGARRIVTRWDKGRTIIAGSLGQQLVTVRFVHILPNVMGVSSGGSRG